MPPALGVAAEDEGSALVVVLEVEEKSGSDILVGQLEGADPARAMEVVGAEGGLAVPRGIDPARCGEGGGLCGDIDIRLLVGLGVVQGSVPGGGAEETRRVNCVTRSKTDLMSAKTNALSARRARQSAKNDAP